MSTDLHWETDGREINLLVDEEVYPRDAVYGAAYLFVDRCFLFLSRPADRQVSVRIRPKVATTPEALEDLAGEFGNELLNQLLRTRVSERTGKIREYVMARAFFSTPQSSSIDALLAELDAEELAEDKLDIEVPWQSAAQTGVTPPSATPDATPDTSGSDDKNGG